MPFAFDRKFSIICIISLALLLHAALSPGYAFNGSGFNFSYKSGKYGSWTLSNTSGTAFEVSGLTVLTKFPSQPAEIPARFINTTIPGAPEGVKAYVGTRETTVYLNKATNQVCSRIKLVYTSVILNDGSKVDLASPANDFGYMSGTQTAPPTDPQEPDPVTPVVVVPKPVKPVPVVPVKPVVPKENIPIVNSGISSTVINVDLPPGYSLGPKNEFPGYPTVKGYPVVPTSLVRPGSGPTVVSSTNQEQSGVIRPNIPFDFPPDVDINYIERKVKETIDIFAASISFKLTSDSDGLIKEIARKIIEIELENVLSGFSSSVAVPDSSIFTGHDVVTDDEILKIIDTFFVSMSQKYRDMDVVERRKKLGIISGHPIYYDNSTTMAVPANAIAQPVFPDYPEGHAFEGYRPFNAISPVWQIRESIKRNASKLKADIEKSNSRLKYPLKLDGSANPDDNIIASAGKPYISGVAGAGTQIYFINEMLRFLMINSKKIVCRSGESTINTEKIDVSREPDFETNYITVRPEKILSELKAAGYKIDTDVIGSYGKTHDLISGLKQK